MTRQRIIVRETIVSIVINLVITAGFFFALFGLGGAADSWTYGRDFLPQSFMVALMGSLIPGLLVRRGSGLRIAPVIGRAVLLAVCALAVGLVAWGICARIGSVPPGPALLIKLAYAAILSAVVTPIAVRAALNAIPASTSLSATPAGAPR